MHETAYAKLNLALHVRGREADGYHRIETAFAFAEDGDRLTVEEGQAIELRVIGPFADRLPSDGDNIVMAAALALREQFRVRGTATLTLDKRLPVASGIGGGSADAAAALRLLARWWRLAVSDAELALLAKRLGADVPACVYSRTARGEGRGDELEFVDYAMGGLPVLLVNPGRALSTKQVFERWGGHDGGPLDDPRLGRNDLEAPAAELVPEIGEVLRILAATGAPELVRMSGSGATCFALFANARDRDEAGGAIASSHPHWWQLASRLR